MGDCLFCKIIQGHIPSEKVYESENVLGFKDIGPMAQQHYLFIHKEHTSNINELVNIHPEHLANIYSAIRDFTQKQGLDNRGFRVVTNQGPDAGQTVFHTHFHVLGGEKLGKFGSN